MACIHLKKHLRGFDGGGDRQQGKGASMWRKTKIAESQGPSILGPQRTYQASAVSVGSMQLMIQSIGKPVDSVLLIPLAKP